MFDMLSKNQIVNGLSKYIESEVIAKIEDKALQIILALGVTALNRNHDLIDVVLNNQFISYLVKKNDEDKYDLDDVFDIVNDTLKTYGKLPVTIPAIKFISPTEKTLRFSTEDVSKLRSFMEQGGM